MGSEDGAVRGGRRGGDGAGERGPGRLADRAARAQGGGRGYVYSMDSMLAILLLVVVTGTVAFLSAQADIDPYAKLQLGRASHDTLVALERQGTLAGLNATAINASLNTTLPDNVGARLRVDSYYYANGTFNLVNSTYFGQERPNGTTVYGLGHQFVEVQNRQLTRYNDAYLEVWRR